MGDKATDYILEELSRQHKYNEHNEHILGNIYRTLAKHKRFGKKAIVLSIAAVGYAIFCEKRISKLSKEVKELKRTKGE